MNKKKQLTVELKWSLLERIAKYYQFPTAVFLGDEKMFKTETREDAFKRDAETYNKIKDIVEEYEGSSQ